MFKNKLFWYVNMGGSLLGWIFAISGFFCPFQNEGLKIIWLVVVFGWPIGHFLELFISLPIGKKAGISPGKIIVHTMLFGFTWWLPLKLGVLKHQ